MPNRMAENVKKADYIFIISVHQPVNYLIKEYMTLINQFGILSI